MKRTKSKRKWIVVVSVALLLVPIIAVTISTVFEIRQENVNHALIADVRELDVRDVETLLENGASANAKDMGRPRLTLPEMFNRLLVQFQHKQEIAPSHLGTPALIILFENRFFDTKTSAAADSIATLLIEHGADYHIVWQEQKLVHLVAQSGFHRTLRLLLSRGESVETRNGNGETLLMSAVTSGDIESVKILLEYKADVNAVNKDGNSIHDGESVLYYALVYMRLNTDRTKIIHLLKQNGAQLNKADKAAYPPAEEL